MVHSTRGNSYNPPASAGPHPPSLALHPHHTHGVSQTEWVTQERQIRNGSRRNQKQDVWLAKAQVVEHLPGGHSTSFLGLIVQLEGSN
ncbi:rCG46097 [Rattus norvegicus]|uniref:RCG46097 n=1 Tax=Rattus norvegicus TaxID=10116 RepID=A6ICR7_RAT|nr:rCG46097 [Rattus norvegicus]